MASMFIDDGYTVRRKIEAVPGLYPAVDVVYRPAIAKVRLELATATGRGVDATFAFENDLIAKHLASLNGGPISPEMAGKLVPNLRNAILDLVLGYAGADEVTDAKNSHAG